MSELSERRSDMLGWLKEDLVDRVIELEDCEDLAHEIAEESSKSLLENSLHSEKSASGDRWLSLRTVSGYERKHGAEFLIERAVRYLETEGILKRSPEDPQLIGWDEMDEEDA